MDFQNLYERARQAGLNAAVSKKVQPMVVGTPKSIFSNEIDETKPSYIVEGGPCGFAEVVVKPGNSRFANWLKKNNLGGRRYYGGGVSVWVSEFGQSYERKMAYAQAFAEVLREANIHASAAGRLD